MRWSGVDEQPKPDNSADVDAPLAPRTASRRRICLAILLVLGAIAAFGGWYALGLPPFSRLADRSGQDPGQDRLDGDQAGTAVVDEQNEPSLDLPEPLSEGSLPDPGSPPPSAPAAVIEEASELARWMMGNFKEDPDAYEIMARVHWWLGDSEKAVAYWQKCLELNPQYIHAFFGLGYLAAEKGDYARAVDLLGRAHRIEPAAAEPRMQLASALINLGKMEKAISILEEDMAITSRSPTGLLMLGMAYRHLKEYGKAKRCYEASIAFRPENGNAHYGLASVCARLGEDELAKKHMDRFNEIRGSRLKDHQNQRRHHDDLAGMQSKLADFCTTAAQVCHGQQDLEHAQILWRRAAALNSANVVCREALALTYRATGRDKQAAAMLVELSALRPNNPDYQLELGHIHAELADFDAAETAYKKVNELAPQYAPGHVALAKLYTQVGDRTSEAIAHGQKAVDLEPTAVNFWILGIAREKGGDTGGALEAIGRAVERDPGNAMYRQKYQSLQQPEAK